MANYNQLKASISAVIKSNNRNEITGQILQNVLNQMVGVIGENYQLAGFATPLTNPGAPDQNVFYVADQGGAYVNFDNIVLDAGLSFLMWKNSQWTSHTVNIVTAEWVEQNYVSIDFFRSLFRAYDVNGDEILPNNPADPITEEQTVVDSIKAMVGFWTGQYISALGHGTGGGGGGGGGATVLDDLLDVTITNPLAGQGLIYNGTKWVNQAIPSGTDMSTVWAALGANTAEQINISHLATALTDYATQSWVNQNFITIAYFDRLFRAYNGSTLVSHNDTTSTIDNIKAMFGFWTDFYVSALGTGGMQSPIGLASLNDVALTSPISDGQALVYNATLGKWVNQTIQVGGDYLPLTGGTMTGAITFKWGTSQTDQFLTFVDSSGNNAVMLGIRRPYDLYGATYVVGGNYYTLLHTGNVKTINGQSLFGSGDISVGGGASGNYLPLTGGTLTNDDYRILKLNRTANSGIGIGFQKQGVLKGDIGFNSSGNFILRTISNNNETTRMTVLANGYVGIAIANPTYPLEVNGSAYISSDEARVLRLNRTSATASLLAFYQEGVFVGDIGFDQFKTFFVRYSSDRLLNITSAGYVGIGTDSPLNKLHVDGSQYISGYLRIATNTNSYSLNVGGTIYATGSVTALSDARHKDVLGDAKFGVEQIAAAPAVQFLWKGERAKEGLQVGTLAQYWQNVLPEVVMDRGGELSMQYGVAAMVSAIVTARKVVDHERRITELERENERLKTEIEQLRLN